MRKRTRHRLLPAVALAVVAASCLSACDVGEVAHQADQVERDARAIDRSTSGTGKLLKRRIDGGHRALRDLSRDGERISNRLLGP